MGRAVGRLEGDAVGPTVGVKEGARVGMIGAGVGLGVGAADKLTCESAIALVEEENDFLRRGPRTAGSLEQAWGEP